MALVPMTIPKFDPNCAVSTPTRPVEGVVKSRPVVLDTDHDEFARFILVGVAGAVSYVGWDGITVVIPNLAAGVYHPIYSIRINSSGTTATDMMWGN